MCVCINYIKCPEIMSLELGLLFLWYINTLRLFNAKFCFYTHTHTHTHTHTYIYIYIYIYIYNKFPEMMGL